MDQQQNQREATTINNQINFANDQQMMIRPFSGDFFQQKFNDVNETPDQNNQMEDYNMNSFQNNPVSTMPINNNYTPNNSAQYVQPPTDDAMVIETNKQNQLFQNPQPVSQDILCLIHKNKKVTSICFSNDCKGFSRLLCLYCLRENGENGHLSHKDKIIDIEEIKYLQGESLIPFNTGISERVSAALNEQSNRDNPEYIEKLFIQMENEVSAGMKKTFKDIMMSVQSNNEILRQGMSVSKETILERYSVKNFLNAFFTYCNSGKQPKDHAEFEIVLNQYADDYSSEEKLEKFLPQSKLIIDLDKFQLAQEKFKEAFCILSEAVAQKSQTEFIFQQSTYAKASRFVKLINNATGVLCHSKDEPMAVFGEKPLEINKCYNLTFNVTGIKARQCWGVLLILDKHVNISTGLCWPTQEKGLFCCFDGDCSNLPNSLKHIGSSRMQDSTFIVTVHIAQRIFQIRNESGTYKAELFDKYQINNEERYFLGFALPDCKLVNVATGK